MRAEKPSSELATHLTTYKVRKGVRTVVHGHPPTAVALATTSVQIPLMMPEHAVLIRSLEVVNFTLPGEEEPRAVYGPLGRCDVVRIRNHGFFYLGVDLHEAASRLEIIEESAKSTW